MILGALAPEKEGEVHGVNKIQSVLDFCHWCLLKEKRKVS